ncbi:hypothetical protein IPH92_00735 [Candidatus Kaiserbacteria bacterium]|nr:MAG: hypothetical protein IPH92_00735 [Candidatus Kaiserbacteria bacterium]
MLGFVYSRREFEKGAPVKFERYGVLLTGRVLEQNGERVRIALTKPVIVVTKTIKKKWFGRIEELSQVSKLVSEIELASHYVYSIDEAHL